MVGMKRTRGHRKRIRHYHDPGHIHELTLSSYHRWPPLTNDIWRGMPAESIDRTIEGHRDRLTALAFMPEHIPRMVAPPQQYPGLPAVHSLPWEWVNEPLSQFQTARLNKPAVAPEITRRPQCHPPGEKCHS